MSLRFYASLSVAAALGACAAFSGTDAPIGLFDGGADADMAVADASFFKYGSSFCSAPPTGTLFCADFDETPAVDAGFASQSASGITLVGDFDGGSAPNSLGILTPVMGFAVVQTPLIKLAPFANKHLAVQWRFMATIPNGTFIRLANLGFDPTQGSPVALAASGLTCGLVMKAITPGAHTLLIDISVAADGTAASYECFVDATSIAPPKRSRQAPQASA